MSEPGQESDLSPAQADQWDATVSDMFDQYIAEAQGRHPGREFRFANAISEAWVGTAEPIGVDWTAFPKTQSGPDRWDVVEHNREELQDEYCEWSATKDGDKLMEVTFTTETPDYYEFLAAPEDNGPAGDALRAVLLGLYHRYVSKDVQLSELLNPNKTFNKANDWNLGLRKPGTIMHFVQGSNTLGAAIQLSAQASWPAVSAATGDPVVSEQALINCLKFGVPTRNSDPHIGAQINMLVRQNSTVSLARPAGLYIDSIDLSSVVTPDDSPISDWFTYTRGAEGFRMRVTFRPPPGSTRSLSELTIDDEPLRFGGQLADKVRVRIDAVATPSSTPLPEPHQCS